MADRSLRSQLEAVTSGRYSVMGELGSGGMATVFLAKDLVLPRNVAIKVLSPALSSDEETVTRFRREAKVAAALDHPGIVGVYDVGDDGALAYFVMQHIDGETLAGILAARGPLSVRSVASVLGSVGRALRHAHGRGIVHRDVKPANLMRENAGRIFVTDFGIAKREEFHGLTASGAVFGTPAYMSPEQYNGVPASPASDQYSLGVVAFELLTGRLPFVGGSITEVMAGHLCDLPPDIRTMRGDVTDRMAEAVARMLAKDPRDRFKDVREAASAMEEPSARSPESLREPVMIPQSSPHGLSDADTVRVVAAAVADPDAQTVLIRSRRRRVIEIALLLGAVLLGLLAITLR